MRKLFTPLLVLLALLAAAAPALGSGKTVLNDCSDDEVLSKTYSQKEYRDALAQLPADADQYGNCRDIIGRAQDAAATKGGSKGSTSDGSNAGATTGGGDSGPGASSAPAKDQLAAASPEDRAAAEAAARGAASTEAAPAGPAATASDVGRAPDSGGVADLPVPVLVLLALLLAGALALAASRVRSLVHSRRA